MKAFIFLVIAIALMALRGHCDDRNLNDLAKDEISRRGNHVEMTGTIRSNLIGQALKPPADDSDKWFITLVINAKDPASIKMRHLIEDDKDVRAWINVGERAHSFAHYDVREWDLAGTQRDWLIGLKDAVESKGLPALVVQPPRNGRFGDPGRIVKMIHGEHTGKQLCDLFRDGIVTYVKSLEAPLEVGMRDKTDDIGVPPPYQVPPREPPNQVQTVPAPNAKAPFDWPQSTPPVLSIDEIEKACPDAPPEFVYEVVKDKETDLRTVKLRYKIYQKEHDEPRPIPEIVLAKPRENSPPELLPNPILPVPSSSPWELLAVTATVAMLSGVVLTLALIKMASLAKDVLAVSGLRNQLQKLQQPIPSSLQPSATSGPSPQPNSGLPPLNSAAATGTLHAPKG